MRNLLLLKLVKMTICLSECRYKLMCLLVDMLVVSDKTTSQCPAGDRTDSADDDDVDNDEESFEKLFEQLRVMKGLVSHPVGSQIVLFRTTVNDAVDLGSQL